MGENELQVAARLVDDRVHFSAGAPGKPEVQVDYFPPYGRGNGHTSLELLLVSLATCFASTVKLMLVNGAGVEVFDLRATASGERRTEHPTTFSSIHLELEIEAPDLARATLDRVLEQAEQTFCPVLASLDRELPVTIVCRLNNEGSE